MSGLIDWLKGKKSFIIATVTILYAIVIIGWQQGDWGQAFTIIWAALGFSAFRAGMNNAVEKYLKQR